MTNCNKPISPLRQRMIDDMTLRKLNPKTQKHYLRAVEKFARFFGRSPDLALAEELRRFQLHLVAEGVSSTTLNATITGLKFFFEVTLDRPEAMKKMSHVYQPRKIPVVLSVDEVSRLLQSAGCLKYQAALGVAYGAGLRASEVCHLTSADIDSKRMVLRVEQGKGKRDRYAMLSPILLALLRAWWREGRAKRQVLPGGWVFPGQNPVNPLSTRSLNRIFHQACVAAKINKRVSLHSLRHYVGFRTITSSNFTFNRSSAFSDACAQYRYASTRHSPEVSRSSIRHRTADGERRVGATNTRCIAFSIPGFYQVCAALDSWSAATTSDYIA